MQYVFLHGLGQTSSSWNETAACMEEKQQNIVCPDLSELLRGRKVTYDDLYKAFSEHCMNLSEPFDICGLSLGGILALQYGIENPSKVHSLVLIGTQFTMPERLLKFQNVVFRFMPDSTFPQMGFSKKDFIQLSKSMMKLDFRNDLNKIMCNVLVVCGSKDKANKKASMELNKYLPHSEIQLIANAGHEVNKDAPHELGKILNDFYDKL